MKIKISDISDVKYGYENIYIDGKMVGYIGKNDLKVGMMKCPKCDKENWAMAVAGGSCAWCQFDLKKIVAEYLEENKGIKQKLFDAKNLENKNVI